MLAKKILFWSALIFFSQGWAENEKVDAIDYARLRGFSQEQIDKQNLEKKRVQGLQTHLKEREERQRQMEAARVQYRLEKKPSAVWNPEEERKLREERRRQEEASRQGYIRDRQKLQAQFQKRPISELEELRVLEPGTRVPFSRRDLQGAKRPSLLRSDLSGDFAPGAWTPPPGFSDSNRNSQPSFPGAPPQGPLPDFMDPRDRMPEDSQPFPFYDDDF